MSNENSSGNSNVMYEINLVPDIKAEKIDALKKQNFIFFATGAICAIAIGIVVVLGIIRAGQEIKIKSQDNSLNLLSNKLEEYGGLDELLTIKKQLSDLQIIQSDKKSVSRLFTVLASILPTGEDSVTISGLNFDLEESTMTFEGQADAGVGTDGIDYRVLESFTKQVGLMKYDYGRYVDKNGAEIPAMCIRETDDLGVPYMEADGSLYAFWDKGVKGCDPSDVTDEIEVTITDEDSADQGNTQTNSSQNSDVTQSNAGQGSTKSDEVVKIYRTPQFSDWYKNNYLSLDGTIQGVEHFESKCISYSGLEGGTVKWVSENSCDLAPEGLEVMESQNGRQGGGGLVLTFVATLQLEPEVFNYNNKHMIAIAPTGRVNVTDSLLQIETMFTEKAIACGADDEDCKGNK